MIVGAGLTGLIAAHAFPRHTIIESAPAPAAAHRALLRFRSPDVGELTGVEFRPVTVRKGVWSEGRWVAPDIRLANLYSRKVLGAVLGRSIWSVEPVTRWIAPEDFYERLLDAAAERITWGHAWDHATFTNEPLISTAPLPRIAAACAIRPEVDFRYAAITVRRFRVHGADVYQTGYFPDPHTTLYRASMTGSLLICEFAGEPDGEWLAEVMGAFALGSAEEIETAHQPYGKIAPILDSERKALIARLTRNWNIFTLGRFATWRNILLDDVVHDIAVVKRLIAATDYDRRLASI